MGRRVQIAVASLLVVLGSLVAWRALRPGESEPSYQGKRFRTWVSEYYYGWLRQDASARMAAESGIRHIGTNGIPILLQMIRQQDSSLVSTLIPLWERHVTRTRSLPAWVRFPSWYQNQARVMNMQAMQAFEVLRAQAQQAVPELITIYDLNISAENQFCVSRALLDIGPEAARAAVPSFVKVASSKDVRKRENAVAVLGQVHAEPSLVVPALMQSLSDTNANIRGLAALGLKQIGWSGGATKAVPALVRLLSDSDGQVRSIAADALKNIDYDAAVKAGVK